MPFQHLVISVPVQNITKILRFCRFFYFVQPVTVCICLHLNFEKKRLEYLAYAFLRGICLLRLRNSKVRCVWYLLSRHAKGNFSYLERRNHLIKILWDVGKANYRPFKHKDFKRYFIYLFLRVSTSQLVEWRFWNTVLYLVRISGSVRHFYQVLNLNNQYKRR
jgi:hypothetical protein